MNNKKRWIKQERDKKSPRILGITFVSEPKTVEL